MCKRDTPFSGFYKAARSSDGRQARCKECHLRTVQAYRSRLRETNSEPPPTDKDKRCPRCNEVKSSGDFHRNRSSVDGLHWVCKPCNKVSGAYRKKVEERRRFRLYNITREEVDALRAHQNDRCAICGDQFIGMSFHIDHDHETDQVRGLLCGKCNTALGLLRDSHRVVARAVEYLCDPPFRRLSSK